MSVRFRISNKVDDSTRNLLKKQVQVYQKTNEDLDVLELKVKKKLFGPYIAILKGHFQGKTIHGSGRESTPAKAFLSASRTLHKKMDRVESRHEIEDAIHSFNTGI